MKFIFLCESLKHFEEVRCNLFLSFENLAKFAKKNISKKEEIINKMAAMSIV